MTALSFKTSSKIFVCEYSCSHLSVSPKGNSSECESKKTESYNWNYHETSTPIYCAGYLPRTTALSTLIHFIVPSLIKPLLCSLVIFHSWEDIKTFPPHLVTNAAFQELWECQHLPRLRCKTTATLLFLIHAERLIFLPSDSSFVFSRFYVNRHLPATLIMLFVAILLLYDPEIRISCWFSDWWLPDCIFLRWHHPCAEVSVFFLFI